MERRRNAKGKQKQKQNFKTKRKLLKNYMNKQNEIIQENKDKPKEKIERKNEYLYLWKKKIRREYANQMG